MRGSSLTGPLDSHHHRRGWGAEWGYLGIAKRDSHGQDPACLWAVTASLNACPATRYGCPLLHLDSESLACYPFATYPTLLPWPAGVSIGMHPGGTASEGMEKQTGLLAFGALSSPLAQLLQNLRPLAPLPRGSWSWVLLLRLPTWATFGKGYSPTFVSSFSGSPSCPLRVDTFPKFICQLPQPHSMHPYQTAVCLPRDDPMVHDLPCFLKHYGLQDFLLQPQTQHFLIRKREPP